MLLHMVFLLSACTHWQPIQGARRRFLLELHSAACREYHAPVLMFDSSLKQLAKSRYTLSSVMIFEKELPRSAQVGIIYQTMPKNGNKYFKRIDFKINFCDLLNHVNLLPIIKDVMVNFYRASTWPITCPILGNHTYNMTDLPISEEIVPPYEQVSKFNTTIIMIDKGKMFWKFTITGAMIPRS